ncbi:hypothetical protein [Fibrella arboris]|uniref:hypothetical protein n=1 Tax=Fibrella arboris TaxID=3242486 RepID=UPI003520F20B
MKPYKPVSRAVWASISGMLLLVVLSGCHDQILTQPLSSPSKQRVKATAKRYLHLTGTINQIYLDTVRLDGTSYSAWAIDSISFYYDDNQRLTRHQLNQTMVISDKKVIFEPTGSTYTYLNGYMQETYVNRYMREALRFPLDPGQRHVLSYNKAEYGYVDVDSIRRYSGEGLLLSALQVRLLPRYSISNNQLPTWQSTLKAGNMTQLEVYNYFDRTTDNVTRYFYDDQHYAPLATFTFLGETSRNALLRKTQVWYSISGVHTSEYVYSNQYDAQGRLIRQLEEVESKGSGYWKYYTLTNYYY